MATLNTLIQRMNEPAKRTMTFEKLLVTTLGASVKEYFPKQKDQQGRVLKGPDGKDLRSVTPQGWTYKFCTLGDNPKIVMAVFADYVEFEPLTALAVSGEGYDIKSSNMIFLENSNIFNLNLEEKQDEQS